MPRQIDAASFDYFEALERRSQLQASQLRREQVAQVLREQRLIRHVRGVLLAAIGISALIGVATLWLAL